MLNLQDRQMVELFFENLKKVTMKRLDDITANNSEEFKNFIDIVDCIDESIDIYIEVFKKVYNKENNIIEGE